MSREGHVQPVISNSEKLPIELRAVEEAERRIKERFEEGQKENQLAFHNFEHTSGVIRRATILAEAMGLSEREQMLSQIAAAFHDTVQDWEPSHKDNRAVVRQRNTERNEQVSAEEAVRWMKEQEDMHFTGEECEQVREAILATVPSWDPELETVIQPNLHPECGPLARVLAMADLDSSGIEPHEFKKDIGKLIAEEELDIIDAIQKASSADDIPLNKQKLFLERFRRRFNGQAAFVNGRKKIFQENLEWYTEAEQEKLRALCSHFDESLAAAQENATWANTCTFEEMAHLLVPDAFSNKEPRTF